MIARIFSKGNAVSKGNVGSTKGMFYLQGMSSWELMMLLVLLLVFCGVACAEDDEGKAEPPGEILIS